MSAIAAHYASPADRRYAHDLAPYDVPHAFFHYSQPSLNAVTASPSSLDSSYALASGPAPSSYAWDTPYPTSSSSSLAATTAVFSSSSHSASAGPSAVSNLATYAPDYASHRPSFSARSSGPYQLSASPPSSSSLASPSSRPSYSSATRPYSSLAPSATSSHTASPSSSRLQHATWDIPSLYTIEPSEPIDTPVSAPSPPISSPPSTPIKSEDPDGEFIIEVTVPSEPAPSSMPEVPLRAIHAAPEMKKMMYAFRLENFAMHDGIKSAATQPGSGGIEVGPLREQPVEIEWQVQLDVPLIAEEEDTFRYGATPQTPNRAGAVRKSALYRADTPVSPRESARASYASVGSASPALSMDYPLAVDNDGWDTSSAYGGNSSSSASASTSSPSFASVMTPAQSLGWSMRGYQAGDVDMESSTYRRPPPSGQSSLSRVSQAHGQYILSGSSKPAYQQSSPYTGYDSSGYSRSASSGRYAQEVYAPSSSSSTWYRS
ncbi:hypothetical protein LXA43DRAFT_175308 [Ganoderma leucocontextum]|nr:hypothetical protein LXA43DRAFT_175308 [Ganoderma leucocontextum]